MSILSAWRARCDRNAELRDERNDLIHAVNDAYRKLLINNTYPAMLSLNSAQRHLDALKVAAKAPGGR